MVPPWLTQHAAALAMPPRADAPRSRRCHVRRDERRAPPPAGARAPSERRLAPTTCGCLPDAPGAPISFDVGDTIAAAARVHVALREHLRSGALPVAPDPAHRPRSPR